MSTPERVLQSSEYYLKYMSWHTKDMAASFKELVAAVNTLSNKLDGVMAHKCSCCKPQATPVIPAGKAPVSMHDVEDTPF